MDFLKRKPKDLDAAEMDEHDALDAQTGKDMPKSAKPVTKDAWDALDSDAQKWLQGIVDCVRAELTEKGAAEAKALLEEQDLDADMKTALWSRLDAGERSAIKAVRKAA